jgi:putative hydrolase of the HAD superfamily
MATDLIFDFFGTLVEYTLGAFHTAPYQDTHNYLLHHGYAISYQAFTSAFTAASQTLEAQAQQTCREYHMYDLGRLFFRSAFSVDVPENVLTAFTTIFLAEWSRGIVYPEAIDPFLERLAARYRLSVLSNTHYPSLIHDNLSAMGVARYFSQVVTSVELGIRKPHPAIFRHTLEQLRIPARDALYIGDTYVDDYQGAAAAGIRCILIDPRGQHLDTPDRIDTLFALEPYLETTVP